MALGMFIGQLCISFATDSFRLLPVGLLCGFLWVCAGAFCFWAVKAEQDLTGAGVRSMGVSILASFVTGVLIFSESTLLYFSIPAILLLLFGLSRLAPPQGNVFRNWRSLLGGLIFGLFLIPYKFAEVPILEFMGSFALGIFVSAELLVAILSIKRSVCDVHAYGCPLGYWATWLLLGNRFEWRFGLCRWLPAHAIELAGELALGSGGFPRIPDKTGAN